MKNNLFLYFDIGNTLIDCSNYFQNAAQHFKLDIQDIENVFREHVEEVTKGTMTPQNLWKECIKTLHLKNADNFDFLSSWVSDYTPIPEVQSFLIDASSRYRVGLISNIYKDMRPLFFEKSLIPNIQYDKIVFSCDVGMMKPDKDIYEYSLTKAGVSPENALYIDDKPRFLQTAKDLGSHTFFFNDKEPKKSVEELKQTISLLSTR